MAKVQGQAWLAKQLGVSQPRVSKLVSEKRIQRKAKYDKGDVVKAKQLLLEARAGNNATVSDLESSSDADVIESLSRNPERVARIKLIIERTAKIKIERELLAGGYVKKEDVDKENMAKVFSLRAKLQEIPMRAALIAHKTEVECERILTDWVKGCCNYYAEGGN